MEKYNIIDADITSPKGFRACGIHIGLKRVKKDLALIVSDVIAEGAAVFTKNKVCAAPVALSKENIRDKKVQAIIINSGNANACTGKEGYKNALLMAEETGNILNISAKNVLVASTGVIGVPLPIDLISKGIKDAAQALSYTGGHDAAEAILTTDKNVKKVGVTLEIDGKTVTIAGMTKGSGMIEPNMATMLAFITTDAKIDGDLLQNILKSTTDNTYNMITVDGDTSTNDTVCVMANGMAENTILTDNHPEIDKFKDAFYYVNEYLAKAIILDGEGATKFLEAEVINGKTHDDARVIVKSILNSNLVKTAFFGEDGNWGRIMCSIGYSETDIDVDKINIYLANDEGKIMIVENGQGTNYKEEDVAQLLKSKNLKILVDLAMGNEGAKGWGCDLSYEYIKINGAYRS